MLQLTSIIRYELQMQWRRRGMLVMMVGLVAAFTLAGLVEKSLMAQVEYPEIPADLRQQVAQLQATFAILYSWPVCLTLMMLALPLVASETIPKDRHYGVRELLDSLTLGRGIYLAGKVLSVWAAVLIGYVVVACLGGLIGWWLFGPYRVGAYLTMWGMDLIPAGCFAAGMGTLLAAGQPNRRRALLAGVAFAVYCIAMVITTSGTVWDAICLARPSAYLLYVFRDIAPGSTLRYPPLQIPLTLGLGAAQIALVWLIAWGYLRWKENS
jgi:hypothetical protein